MSTDKGFNARKTFQLEDGSDAYYYDLSVLEEQGLTDLKRIPMSIRMLLEAALRNHDGFLVRDEDVKALAAWSPTSEAVEIPFRPARVVLQDFTGVPGVVDLAALRNAMVGLGGDPTKVNPLVPVDLVVDHSVQVDVSGRYPDARARNLEIEYKRNGERYEFLKWGQNSLDNFRVVPPGRGIVHQVNLEWLASVAAQDEEDGKPVYFPDTLVGTDSHTTMINGLGVLGWGVGGIEAEAVMLGQPIYMLAPEVVGFRISGELKEGVTATDMTLRVVEIIRAHGVVGKFVEFFGPGIASMSLPDRATIANMAPEYGATCGFFPVDKVTLDYLRLTGRDEDHVKNVERYYRANGFFVDENTPEPEFSEVLELDLGDVEASVAGPKRPQDRINLSDMKREFRESLTRPFGHKGQGLEESQLDSKVETTFNGETFELTHGDIVIAAITSCTNTSNPDVMMAAGLLARNAVDRGLKIKPWVKPSLAPGSRVVTDYYKAAGLENALDELGFNLVGYGCTTCIGNAGPLDEPIDNAIIEGELVTASVLSGNRNFEGRIHPRILGNYLMSPPLVVAYAIAGTVDIDLQKDSLGKDKDGNDVFLADIWPSDAEIAETVKKAITPDMFLDRYSDITQEPRWDEIAAAKSDLYPWDEKSTYIQQPPFFEGMPKEVPPIQPIKGARALLKLGDSVTTDHISPAGLIGPDTPAGQYLQERGVEPRNFNSYGSRRGNDRVMTRGTFANALIRNQMAPGTTGGWTTYLPTGEVTSVYEAAMKYRETNTPLIVLAGTEYGTGSSRDWAAKGTLTLGVKAVIATSYERIHRSNLLGMGVLPLTFKEGETADTIGLDGTETFDIPTLSDDIKPLQELEVIATKTDGTEVRFQTVLRLDTEVDVEYYRNGGILQTVIRKLV